jgi:hypothetical protein
MLKIQEYIFRKKLDNNMYLLINNEENIYVKR